MTIKDLVYSTFENVKIKVVSYVELYNATIELKFSNCDVKNAEYILTCNVTNWKIENDLSIIIWTNDDILVKLLRQLERE